jgi:phenylacetate-CoA ligase
MLARKVLAPAYDVLRGTHTTRCLGELERSQWWPRERIEELQSQRLRQLIEHAYRTVPHYRAVMQERRVAPADIRSAADLTLLPVLTRPEVQEHRDELLSEGFPARLLRPTKTSGSTGTPLLFYGTVEDQIDRGFARGVRALGWTGLRLGDRSLSIGRARLYSSKRERMLRGLSTRLRHRLLLPVDSLTNEALPDIVRRLSKLRLDGIGGYPNGVALLAAALLDSGTTPPALKAVVTGGAELLGHERELIRQAFGLEPCSNYSAYEAFAIACECQAHAGLHVAAEDIVVEIVDDEGLPVPPGVEGRILVTNLHNYGMPFIRYDLGDAGTLLEGDCPCGRSLPRLGALVGRKSRFFVTSSGRRVFAGMLYLDRLAGLGMRQYQVVQDDLDNVVMRLIPSPGETSPAALASLEAKVRDMFEPKFGPELALHVEFVDRILPTEAGKHVFMYSQVASTFTEQPPDEPSRAAGGSR